jgi:hypothetical protein
MEECSSSCYYGIKSEPAKNESETKVHGVPTVYIPCVFRELRFPSFGMDIDTLSYSHIYVSSSLDYPSFLL